MKLLYIGTDALLQQRIVETLSKTRTVYEMLVATSKEELIETLERGVIDILLFDSGCPANVSLQQARLYTRAFKTPVILLKSVAATDYELSEDEDN